jgi:hypothetical protein
MMHRFGLLIWIAATFLVGLSGCRTGPVTTDQGDTTAVNGTVVKLTRATNGSFRYYGEFRIQSPARYRGKKVSLFIISHEEDACRYVGKDITFMCNDYDLTCSVEPISDPFSISQAEPHVSVEYADNAFRPIDYMSYEKPIYISGVVRSFDNDKGDGGIYFQFDVGFSGDMASVEVTTPAKYQGLIIHVLVNDQPRVKSVSRSSWKTIGTRVSFSVPESTLAWEPRGFTPSEQLQSVSVDAN